MSDDVTEEDLDPRIAALLACDAVWLDPPGALWTSVEAALRDVEEE